VGPDLCVEMGMKTQCAYCGEDSAGLGELCAECIELWKKGELARCARCRAIVQRELLTYTDNTNRDYCADCHNRLAYPEAE
jgi:hypothetical protein